ncbi:MAG: GPW/gp25 family protein [Gemmatimonas sp.]|jgi:phage baseplate assembly protein W|nr:GPW/gp25 family protein [Rubrivivax sp.]
MSTPARLFGQGIAFPPRVGADGRLAWSAGEPNVREAIRIVLLTAEGERLRRPRFGGSLAAFLFEPNNAATHQALAQRIARALAEWEPRITVEQVQVVVDPADADAAIATITYRLVATRVQERVSLAVSLAANGAPGR